MLRKIIKEDLDIVFQWRNTLEIRTNMINHQKISMQEHKSWFDHLQNSETKTTLIYMEKNLRLGVVSLDLIEDDLFEWGFYSSPLAPLGTGTRMCLEALDFAFAKLSARSVIGKVLEFNKKSQKFHLKIGFKEISVDLNAYQRDNESYSIYNYAFNRENWITKKSKLPIE